MPKTFFESGTTVFSTWLNKHFFTNGGHKHDGIDEDGSSSKIDLNSHVDGLLPVANMDEVKDVVDTYEPENAASDLNAKIDNKIDQLPTVPIGGIVEWFGTFVPPGFLECNGGLYSVVTYPDLFDVLGIDNTPALSGLFTVGAGVGPNAVNYQLNEVGDIDTANLLKGGTPNEFRVVRKMIRAL